MAAHRSPYAKCPVGHRKRTAQAPNRLRKLCPLRGRVRGEHAAPAHQLGEPPAHDDLSSSRSRSSSASVAESRRGRALARARHAKPATSPIAR